MNLKRWVLRVCCFAIFSQISLLASALVGTGAIANEPAVLSREAVDLRKLRVPTEMDRNLLKSWLTDLQSRSMLVDRMAVDVSGEKYIGAQVGGSERIVARRFAFTWVIDHQWDRERLVFADQSLLGSAIQPTGNAYLIDSQASAYDQIRIKRRFHGASGKQVHPPSTTKSLNARFKLCGVFDPICATTGGVISITTGNAFDRSKCQLHVKNLIGIYRHAGLTLTAFEFQPVPELIFVRVASFRRSVPVQVDDFVSLGTDLLQVAQLGDNRGQKELSSLHKILKPYAQTTSAWDSVDSVLLPVKLHSLTLGGEQDFEVKADFQWKLGSQIPDSVFEVENLGVSSPLALWSDKR